MVPRDAVCGVPADYAEAVIDNTLALLATITTEDHHLGAGRKRFCQSLMFSSPEDWIELTRVAEQAGFDQVSLSDHVFYPDKLDSSYPYTPDGKPMFPAETPWPDVWVTTGAPRGHRAHHLLDPRGAAVPQPVRGGQGGGDRRLPVGRPVVLGRLDAGGVHPARAALRPPGRPHGGADRRAPHPAGGMVEHHGEFYDFDRWRCRRLRRRRCPS